MTPPTSSAKILRFGVFEVDVRTNEIRKHGLRLKLSDQPFQILAMLLETPGEIVTREELRCRLWPGDAFVDFDHGLNNAVMRVREILNDSSDSPRFVETVPRRGYRFIAPVEECPNRPMELRTPSAPPEPFGSASVAEAIVPKAGFGAGENRRWRFWLRALPITAAASALALVLAVIVVRYLHGSEAGNITPAGSKSLVVLPLENLSGDKSQDYFADGMTDELIASLAKIRSLRVISRSTAMAYKDTRKPLSQIARELNVDAVVEGTVLRAGNRIRITAELVQVATDRHLWAETYESDMGDVLTLQNRVSSAIVDEIRIQLTAEDKERLARKREILPEAYENYLKGRYYWNKRSEENLTKSISYYEEAMRLDPQYALAYAGLSDSYAIISATLFGTMSPSVAAPKAKAAAMRAVEIDPTLAEAQTSLATVKFNYDWDWAGAAEGFERAIRLNPSYATVHQRYSLYLMAMGRVDESLAQIETARSIDPLSMSINSSLGWRLYMGRQYDRAIGQLTNTLEMAPNYDLPHWILGKAYEQKGDFNRAIPELRKAVELSHETPLMLLSLAHADALAGNKVEALTIVNSLFDKSQQHYVSPYDVAVVYAGLGQREKAMDWLERAFSERANGVVFIKVDPELDVLRSDPRFQDLQRKLRLTN